MTTMSKSKCIVTSLSGLLRWAKFFFFVFWIVSTWNAFFSFIFEFWMVIQVFIYVLTRTRQLMIANMRSFWISIVLLNILRSENIKYYAVIIHVSDRKKHLKERQQKNMKSKNQDLKVYGVFESVFKWPYHFVYINDNLRSKFYVQW